MKKNAKKKALATLVALVLVIACAVGATFAWFTDTTTAVENVFTVGNIDIILYETNAEVFDHSTVTTQTQADTQNGNYRDWLNNTTEQVNGMFIVPGRTVAKQIHVKNIGANDAYVQVVVKVPKTVNDLLEIGDADTEENALYDLDVDSDSDPTYVIYTYTFKEVVEDGAKTESVFDTVMIKTDATQADFAALDATDALDDATFGIIVYANAIQAEGFASAEQAFAGFVGEQYNAPGYVAP